MVLIFIEIIDSPFIFLYKPTTGHWTSSPRLYKEKPPIIFLKLLKDNRNPASGIKPIQAKNRLGRPFLTKGALKQNAKARVNKMEQKNTPEKRFNAGAIAATV